MQSLAKASSRPVTPENAFHASGSSCSPSLQLAHASDGADGLYHSSPNDSSRPLVDLDLVITFLPALLLGVSIGESRSVV